jgi:hypothetical protein
MPFLKPPAGCLFPLFIKALIGSPSSQNNAFSLFQSEK